MATIPQTLLDQLTAVQVDQDALGTSKAAADTAAASLQSATDTKAQADSAVAADKAHRDTDVKALHTLIDQLYSDSP